MVKTSGAQTVAGVKTFSDKVVASGGVQVGGATDTHVAFYGASGALSGSAGLTFSAAGKLTAAKLGAFTAEGAIDFNEFLELQRRKRAIQTWTGGIAVEGG